MPWSKVGDLQFNVADGAGTEAKTLPGTPQQYDIVILVMASDDALDVGIVTAGYTYLLWDSGETAPGCIFAYKQMGATPDTQIVINQSGGEYSAGVLQVWRGADESTPLDVAHTIASGGGLPDCPSITTVTHLSLVIALGALDDLNNAATITAPAGYTDLLTHDNTANPDNACAMMASKIVTTAGVEDPAAFGGTGSDNWFAVTVALRIQSIAHVGTISDTVGVTDTLTRVYGHIRTITNTVGVTDVLTRIGTFIRSKDEPVGVTDALVRTGTFIRSIADSIGITDVVTYLVLLFVNIADTVGITDTLVRTGTFVRSKAETVGITDAVVRTGTFIRSKAESVGVTDVLVRIGTFFRLVENTMVGVTDVTALLINYIRGNADTVSITDALVRTGTFFRSKAETIGITDALARTGTFVRSIFNAVSITDAVIRTGTFFRSITDPVVAITDVAARVVTYIRGKSDTVGITDVVSREGTFIRTISDTVNASDLQPLIDYSYTNILPDPFGNDNVRAIKNNGTLWVACGNNAKVGYSSDGKNWSLGTSLSGTLEAIAWNGVDLLWAICSVGKKVFVSSNGINWTQAPGVPTLYRLYDIAHDQVGLWATSGDTGKIITSPNATVWTVRTTPFGTSQILGIDVDVANGVWVAAGSSSKLARSTDGINWGSLVSVPVSTTFLGVAHNQKDLWVAVGTSGKIISSPDGNVWTDRSGILGSTHARDVAYDPVNNEWTIVADSGKVANSYNGIAWTLMTGVLSNQSIYAIESFGPLRVVGGSSGKMAWAAKSRGVTYSQGFFRTIADTVGITDIVTKTGTWFRSILNTIGITTAVRTSRSGVVDSFGPPTITEVKPTGAPDTTSGGGGGSPPIE